MDEYASASSNRRFPVDQDLLKAASECFRGRTDIFWLLGSSCTGKTTLCKQLATSQNIAVCDMDARIFGSYLDRYLPSKHPASCEWLKRADALRWALSLSWEEFNDLNEATNVEVLDLFSQEIMAAPAGQPLLVDGGLSHPHLLAQVLPIGNMICIQRREDIRVGTWHSDENKLQMKAMILALRDGNNLWKTFLHFDAMITKTLHEECLRTGIRIVSIDNGQSVSETAHVIHKALASSAMQIGDGN